MTGEAVMEQHALCSELCRQELLEWWHHLI